MKTNEKYLKPAEYAEKVILESIIDQTWKPGDTLPPERELAVQLGITRPTLRETLQRLGREGWIKIRHGKPTIVNNYKEEGGIGMLKTLATLKELTPAFLIKDWLEYRMLVLPEIAQKSVLNHKEELLDLLEKMPKQEDDRSSFSEFDTGVQFLFVKYGNNSIVKMTFNDIKDTYKLYTNDYFNDEETKSASLDYYRKLRKALIDNRDIRDIVKEAMTLSMNFWNNNF